MQEETDLIDEPPSPCVRNCCLDDQKVCLGCFRTITEICDWHEASAREKLEILARSRARYRERHLR